MAEATVETIGRVRLDKRWYPGEDRYSDGDAAENALLSVVESHDPSEYNEIIMRQGSWPLLYHLSPVRENIISWYPFREGAKVLELGAGCGAVTGALLDRGLHVCAVDLSLRRCRINATRHADSDDLQIIVGPIEEVLGGIGQRFDYVLLIGVLEYAAVFSDADRPFERMLEAVKGVMKPDGELLVAIENRLGLKYWAGCREDHTGRYFESVEGYPHRDGPATFSRGELAALAEGCGFAHRFYYPYPDYKFPIKVFSDERPPLRGELNRNWHAFDASRLRLFDEDRAANALVDAGLTGEMANSFLVRLTLAGGGAAEAERVLYVKSSVERRPEYRHHTLIIQGVDGKLVRKRAVSAASRAHLRHMEACRKALTEGLKPGTRMRVAPCRVNGDGTVDFEFCAQPTLQNVLSGLRGDFRAFRAELLRFRDALTEAWGVAPFRVTEGFREMFGEAGAALGGDALAVTNLDLNFDNVFIDDGGYTVVDYEWVLPFPVPLSFVLYRALLVNKDMADFPEAEREAIWASLGIDGALRETYFRMELAFQRHVSGDDDKLERFENAALDRDARALNLEQLLNYKTLYEAQLAATQELSRQLEAHHAAVEDLSRQLEAHHAAVEDLSRQRDEYHAINDELWKRVGIAEHSLDEANAELEELRKPFWRRTKR